MRKFPDGQWHWELKNGGTTDFPQPAQELATFSDTLKVRDECVKVFKDYKRLSGTNPEAAGELARMFGAKYMR